MAVGFPACCTMMVSSYQYHHGYYDGWEREFRGFGRVDRTDAQSFADFSSAETANQAAYQVPPMHTRTWYHTGAWLQESNLITEYKKEFWPADNKANELPETTRLFLDATTLFQELVQGKILDDDGKILMLPNSAGQLPLDPMFDPYRNALFHFLQTKGTGQVITVQDCSTTLNLTLSTDADMLREADRTLHGSVLRTEVYGNDDSPWQDMPYSVSESQFVVKQLQEKDANKYAVFLLHNRESISYDYERVAADPRVSHDFVLKLFRRLWTCAGIVFCRLPEAISEYSVRNG